MAEPQTTQNPEPYLVLIENYSLRKAGDGSDDDLNLPFLSEMFAQVDGWAFARTWFFNHFKSYQNKKFIF